MPAPLAGEADARTNDEGGGAQLRLARAILHGWPTDAARLARTIARHERAAVAGALG